MQLLWLRGLNWDDHLPSDILQRWKRFRQELKDIESFMIPRWIQYQEEISSFELHGFCDASLHAYAAAIYGRVVKENGEIYTGLLMAKSKVAPIKQITLPRLELCEAALLTKLYLFVKQSLRISCKIVAWTDSMIVLSWLQEHPGRWKIFVGNRVAEIQTDLPPRFWRHVPTGDNPADCATRGLFPSQLKEHKIWWEGPEWLKRSEEHWPQRRQQESTELEKKALKIHLVVPSETFTSEMTRKFSSLTKLLRITSFVFRFIRRCQKRPTQFNEWITLEEMNTSLMFWIKQVQDAEFKDDIQNLKTNKVLKQSNLLKLNPFLDGFEILRVGGRLSNSTISWSERHPVILPSKHPLTELIIAETHLTSLHGGTQLMLGLLRKRYWILNGRNAVRSHVHKCITCFRQRGLTRSQLMGNLPKTRVEASRAFSHSSIDYCGPLDIRMSKGRGCKTYKGYLAIFVCFVTRAIHIEVVSDLTTSAFLAALKRFTSRRGLPNAIYTDCGTNFVGAKSILNKDFSHHLNQLQRELPALSPANKISWHFSPPGAPHFNGLCEAGVKATKFHLRRILGNTSLTYEELTTLTSQVEACLNSRPICAQSDDPTDMSALTPGHFLTGDAILAIPEPTYLNVNQHALSRWQYLQQLLQSFWKRWQLDYISAMQQRNKWNQREKNLKIGHLVLVKDERMPPSKWLLARVVEVHEGDDNLARVATIRTKNGLLKRPIVKLSLLPINELDDQKNKNN